MADEADIANRLAHKHTREALKAQKEKAKNEKRMEPMGECYFCGEELEGEKLFCNGKHAMDYEDMIARNPKLARH